MRIIRHTMKIMEIAHLLVLLFSAARKAVVLHNLVNLFRFHILVDKLLDLHFLCYNVPYYCCHYSPKPSLDLHVIIFSFLKNRHVATDICLTFLWRIFSMGLQPCAYSLIICSLVYTRLFKFTSVCSLSCHPA